MRILLRAALVLSLFAMPALADPSPPATPPAKPPADTAKPAPNGGSDVAKPPQGSGSSDTTPSTDKPAKCHGRGCRPPK